MIVYFLRLFVDDLMSGEVVRFDFVSGEPGCYPLKAELVREDSLVIGGEEVSAAVIALRPDLGAMSLVVDRFVPPTLLWYAKSGSHPWLKYEGLESGRGSAQIITTVEEIEPPL